MKDYEYMQMTLDIFGKPENVGGGTENTALYMRR